MQPRTSVSPVLKPISSAPRRSQANVSGRDEVFRVLDSDKQARQPKSIRPLYPLSSLLPGDWNYDLPTIAAISSTQLLKNRMITSLPKFQAAFDKKYGRYFSEVNFNNIMIAGGSVSALLLQQNWNNDVDVFVYGLTVEEADQRAVSLLEGIIASNASYAVKEYRKSHLEESDEDELREVIATAEQDIAITRTEHVITFSGAMKIEIVLRLYAKKEDILYGFDLGSCAVGYDGENVYFSGLGKYSYEHLVNIVDPSRRSTTYEHRLEKYFNRGFSIVLPDLDVTALRTSYFRYGLPEVAELPYFPFSYTAVKGNKITLGSIIHLRKNSARCSRAMASMDAETLAIVSDYDGEQEVDEYKIFYLNLRNLVRGGNSYYYYTEKIEANAIMEAKPYISASRISDYYDSLGQKIFNGRSLDVRVFSEYFSVELLPEVVDSILVKKDCDRLESLLEEQKNIVLQRLQDAEAIDHSLIAWNNLDPGTQLTGSFNPVLSDARDWYGEYYAIRS